MLSADELVKRYPWLRITTTVEDYVDPAYYDRLLKPYRFEGKDDLEIFADYLASIPQSASHALELGPGTGRITEVTLRAFAIEHLTLVDLSPKMIQHLRARYQNEPISYEISDSLAFLEKTSTAHDLIYTLWSFSHSIHQLLSRVEYEEARAYVRSTLRKAMLNNLLPGGNFYLVHFDTESDEQKILIKQWARKYPFYNEEHRNPSKLFIDETLRELEAEGALQVSIRHRVGEPIEYASVDEALEIFMNFHLESHFNEDEDVADVMEDLMRYFDDFIEEDGRLRIRPACYEYEIKRRAT